MRHKIKFIEEYNKLFKKLRKDFRKAMGRKTIKIDGLQHFKLALVKMDLQKKAGVNMTYGDTIEFLCEKYTEELKDDKK